MQNKKTKLAWLPPQNEPNFISMHGALFRLLVNSNVKKKSASRKCKHEHFHHERIVIDNKEISHTLID